MKKSEASKPLIVVESPAKARTIDRLLANRYLVAPCFGHVRDLPKNQLGVDVDSNFDLKYEVSREKQKTVSSLKKLAKSTDLIILASDEDREGEAIASHVLNLIASSRHQTQRIVFHEITAEAIQAALLHPRDIDERLVNAQQTRRALDRLVGYELSPLLWKKVRRGLSAGRVQSVAVRLIVEREARIKAFTDRRYYRLRVTLGEKTGKTFQAQLKSPLLKKHPEALNIIEALRDEPRLRVKNIDQDRTQRSPTAPFTTSTLQQVAAYRLKMSVKQTMVLAQQLYEDGLITYMRTDSVHLARIAKLAIADHIRSVFGPQYLGQNVFTTMAKSAQEAHEAIRPTDIKLSVAGDNERQKQLYQLILERTLASQMAAAQLENQSIILGHPSQSECSFLARGSKVLFDGFLKVAQGPQLPQQVLPDLRVGDWLEIVGAIAEEKSKTPPARYSEATLVKKLEELGIGRPSTYAPTISTIQDRGYVEKNDVTGRLQDYQVILLEDGRLSTNQIQVAFMEERGKLLPTEVGEIVTNFLLKHFATIMDYDFTAQMEKQLDAVALGKSDWKMLLKKFYGDFKKNLQNVEKNVTRQEAGGVRLIGADPQSHLNIYARYSRYGPVLQLGESSSQDKPRFAPLPPNEKIDTVTLEQALQMLSLPRQLTNPADAKDPPIEVSVGRFGPYLKYGGQYASIDVSEIFSIDREEALRKLHEASQRRIKTTIQQFETSAIKVLEGRYGPYVSDGKTNAAIPKGIDPVSLSEAQAKALLAKRRQARPRRRRRGS